MNSALSIYILPPVLSLAGALYLAVLALTRTPRNRENVLFALVCLWLALLSPVFISHHLIQNETVLLSIERHVHFFYVYFPVVGIVFYHHMLGIRKRGMIIALFALSLLFSLTTSTDRYFYGLHHYSWGYIAKGGIAFQVFGIYSTIALGYCIYCSVRYLKRERNPRKRLKQSYMLISLLLIGVMTLMNIPAINGFDLYPIGNFIFLPLAIMGYGLFKYHLLEIKSLAQITLTRVLLAIIALLPNYYLFSRYGKQVAHLPNGLQFIVFTTWFGLNYFYVRQLNSLLGKLFYKTRHALVKAQTKLNSELLVLRNAHDLARHANMAIIEYLPFAWSRVDLFDGRHKQLVTSDGQRLDLSDPLAQWLSGHSHIIEEVAVQASPVPAYLHEPLTAVMADLDAVYAVPLVNDKTLAGLLVLPAKENGQPLNGDEASFIKNIAGPLALALSNTVMYEHISTLKDRLQKHTHKLTAEIKERKRTERELKDLQRDLLGANTAMEKAMIEANEMRARVEISNHELTRQMEDRKRVEIALRESEATYRLIADNASDVIWTMNLDGHFTFMSPAVQHLLGYTPDEILALTSKDVLTEESFHKSNQVIAEEMARRDDPTAQRAKSRATELEQVRKDGTTVWTEVNTRFILDANREITGILGVTRDISQRRASEQALFHMAHHDELTSLYNRKAFMELLEKELKFADRHGTDLALIFCDLNNFKKVNDTFGHGAGDALLQSVADRIKGAIRQTDYLARLGGDEFTIILKNPKRSLQKAVAQRIVSALAKPFDVADQKIDFVGVSIGIAVFPKDGRMAEQLLKKADLAMYEAKKRSDHWCFFDPSLVK